MTRITGPILALTLAILTSCTWGEVGENTVKGAAVVTKIAAICGVPYADLASDLFSYMDADAGTEDGGTLFIRVVSKPHGVNIKPEAIVNGAVLTPDDDYRIEFGTDQDRYIYIAQLDSKGRLFPLFPKHGRTALVKANRRLTEPEIGKWFFLDDVKGVETVYLITSPTPNHKIETLFAKARELGESDVAVVQSESVLDESAVYFRGIGGTRSDKENPPNQEYQLLSDNAVITIWFRHK